MRVKLLTPKLKNSIVVNLQNVRAVQAFGKQIHVYYAPATFFQKLFGFYDIDVYNCYTENQANEIVEEYLKRQKH